LELLKKEREFKPLGEKVYEYEKIESPGFVYEVTKSLKRKNYIIDIPLQVLYTWFYRI